MDWVKIFSSVGEMERAVPSGQPRLLIVRSKRICLIREDHELRAIEDRCSHNGESLSKGSVNFLSEIVCPLHGYRFNIKTGRESSERSPDLNTYPLKEEQEGIFIGL